MIDIISRKLALAASTNAAAAVRAAITKAAVPTQVGAVGDAQSAAADQTGFGACFTAIAASRSASPTGTLDLYQHQNGMEIEPGIYDAGGFTMTDGKSWLKARIPGTVIIRIPDGQYFLTVTGGMYSLFWDGITFIGGKGAFKATQTTANPCRQLRFTNCVFGKYTECAISNNYSDSPFLKIDNCQFDGLNAKAAIAWGGFVDQLTITENSITGNDYGICIGPYLSGNYNVVRNDLLQNRKADIWIKPTAGVSNNNAGWAGAIIHNKFGNEMQTVANPYPRILIANEDTASGADRATRTPLSTAAGDSGWLVLPTIAHNRFAHILPYNAPVIRSYVSNLCHGHWTDNKFDGGQPTYVIEWPNGRNADYSNTNSHFEFRESDGQAPLQFASHPFGRLLDYASWWPGEAGSALVYPVSDQPGLSIVANGLSPAVGGAYGAVSASLYADPYGGVDYNLLTGTTTGTNFGRYYQLATAGMGAGGSIFVEMALQQAPTRSVQRVQIDIINTNGSAYAMRRTVYLRAGGSRFMMPVLLPPSASPGSWQLRVYVLDGDVVSGVTDRFVLGDVLVNAGDGRMGRARALSTMAAFPRNAAMFGGAPATLPTGWSVGLANGLAGLVTTINGVGVDTNGAYVEIALSGTVTAAGTWNLYPEVARAVNVAQGQVWAFYWPMRLVSGGLPNANTATGTDGTTGTLALSVPQFNSSDGWLLQPSTAVSPSATYALYGHGAWTNWNTSANYIRPAAGVSFPVGAVVSAVLRFYQPTVRRMA
jgi:hypothetical protein